MNHEKGEKFSRAKTTKSALFPRQNDWTSKCHYKASNLAVNQCLIPLVGVFKKFECTLKTFEDSLWLK